MDHPRPHVPSAQKQLKKDPKTPATRMFKAQPSGSKEQQFLKQEAGEVSLPVPRPSGGIWEVPGLRTQGGHGKAMARLEQQRERFETKQPRGLRRAPGTPRSTRTPPAGGVKTPKKPGEQGLKLTRAHTVPVPSECPGQRSELRMPGLGTGVKLPDAEPWPRPTSQPAHRRPERMTPRPGRFSGLQKHPAPTR